MSVAETALQQSHWGGGVAPFGATWQKTMMWIFIVTDALLFSALLSGYGFLRNASTSPWPNRPDVFSIPFIALMTFILISSSVFMAIAVTAARLGDHKKALLNVILTIVGGAAFLGCQAYEWTHFIHDGARLWGAVPGADTIHLQGTVTSFTVAEDGIVTLEGQLTETDVARGDGVAYVEEDVPFQVVVSPDSWRFTLPWCELPTFDVEVTGPWASASGTRSGR